MDAFPVLKADRLLLREFVHTDAQAVFDIFSLNEVAVFLDSETMHAFDEADKKFQNWRHMRCFSLLRKGWAT